MKKTEQSLREIWDSIKCTSHMNDSTRIEELQKREIITYENDSCKLPKLMKVYFINPRRINPKRSIHKHITVKFSRDKRQNSTSIYD